MPYIIISYEVDQLHKGPTYMNDSGMSILMDNTIFDTIAIIQQIISVNGVRQYEACPEFVLDKFEKTGYKVVGMTCDNQHYAWTLHKDKQNVRL